MTAATCDQSPERVPSRIPRRAPATLTSWHGNPAVSTSTGGAAQSGRVMSPRLTTPG
jgi:hypothetical protein